MVRDVLQVQDEIVARLSHGVGMEMVRSEARRSRSQGGGREDAVDLVMCGNAVMTDLNRKERAAEALALFTRALSPEGARGDRHSGCRDRAALARLDRRHGPSLIHPLDEVRLSR